MKVKFIKTEVFALIIAFVLLSLASCSNSDSPTSEVSSNNETASVQSETTASPPDSSSISSRQPLPYEIGHVSVISNNAKREPYIHLSSVQVVIDGQITDGVGTFLSLEEVSKSLSEIQYADDFQVIVEGEDAEIPTYSLYNDEFENLYSYQNELSIPSEVGTYLLFVAVTWSNGEVNPQYKEYTLNEYIFKVKVSTPVTSKSETDSNVLSSQQDTLAESEYATIYIDVLNSYFDIDPGLHEGMEYMAIDMASLTYANDADKTAIITYFGNKLGIEIKNASIEDLQNQGLVHERNYIDGILVYITKVDVTTNTIMIEGTKFRSGDGANGIKSVLEKSGDKWILRNSEMTWIS